MMHFSNNQRKVILWILLLLFFLLTISVIGITVIGELYRLGTHHLSANHKRYLLSIVHRHGGKRLEEFGERAQICKVRVIQTSDDYFVSNENLRNFINMFFDIESLLQKARVEPQYYFLKMNHALKLQIYRITTPDVGALGIGIDDESKVALIALYDPSSKLCSIGQSPFVYLHFSEFVKMDGCLLPKKCVIEFYEPVSKNKSVRVHAIELGIRYHSE